ncbi:MAG: GTPase-activating protein [Alyxoria varia]|nr:MAG: GTPase-activating protein [Alyxoria varia]
MSGKESDILGPGDKMPEAWHSGEKNSQALEGEEKTLEAPHGDGMKLDIQNGMGQKPEPTDAREGKSKALRFPNFKRRKADREKKNAEKEKDATVTPEDDPLQHLPQHERDIIQRQLTTPDVNVTVRALYRYATRYDWLIIVVSALTAIAADDMDSGATLPLQTVVFGQLAGTFQNFFLGLVPGDEFASELAHFTLYFVYLGVAMFVATYISTVGFIYTGEHVTRKIREQYLAAIMRQNIGFFDKLGAGEVTTRITSETNQIQDGISEKVAITLTSLSTFIAAFVIGFIKYWLLTLILCSSVVAIAVCMGAGSSYIIKHTKNGVAAYAAGGTVAEEVLSSIRNATAFGTQDKLAGMYDMHLKNSQKSSARGKSALGVMLGLIMCIVYLNYALAFWEGSRLLVQGQGGIGLSDILTILLAIMIGAFSIGNVAPNVSAFMTALAAANKIYSTIDRTSPLDPTNEQGRRLDDVEGVIDLQNVKQIYPSRPEVVVMEDVSLTVPASKTTALVGASGSGKSTIVGLVERFYDPVGGRVLLDGIDVRDLNLNFLRQQISLVSQEPTLFGTTIFGNICHGLIGTKYEDVSDAKKMELVVDAAKMSNAHDFISELPEGYETNVGERGFLMSGGQKQRIAIARAVVSDPRILLLDEATSALDTKSEGVVQAALDKAAQGRTTIIIAHRLSTIKDADNIVVMSEGKIVEMGTHDELLGKGAAYHKLVQAQEIAQAEKQETLDDAEAESLERKSRSSSDSDTKLKAELTKSKSATSLRLRQTISGKSASSKVLKSLPGEERPRYSLWTLIKVVGSYNKPERLLMLAGTGFAVIAGAGQPVQSVLFAKCIVALSQPPALFDKLRSDINFWCWMYFMLALVQFIGFTGENVIFAICSERLIRRARNGAFRSMLRQNISWFDMDESSAGALTSYLATEAKNLAGLSGSTLGTILNVSTTLFGSCIIALAVGWKLALVCIATVPVMLASGYLRFWMLARLEARSKAAYEKSASYACEATGAIRTVASLTREHDVWDNYHGQLVAQEKKSLRSISKSAALYSASQASMFLSMALGFWYGGTLLGRYEYTMEQFFICFTAVIFGAQSAGTIFSFAPDMSKAKNAAAELKFLSDRKPPIDVASSSGSSVDDGSVKGYLSFRDVHFRYPTRPEQPVLRGLNLEVKPGQYVALVGPSGCGKSTTISLLERFYDPTVGSVQLDGRNVSSLNLADYRKHLALVSQEPTLYQGTIRENILLGSPGDDSAVTQERIEKSCASANILSFIQSLPDGFNTVVGNKGVMLSGGQKQRLAIARALLRNPKVLLLDEATSALDSESEKVVQAALDEAAKGRTTVAVAHRLSTIQRADRIFVFDGGVIVEAGTHAELMQKKGRYFELVELQSLEKHT